MKLYLKTQARIGWSIKMIFTDKDGHEVYLNKKTWKDLNEPGKISIVEC